MKPETLLAQGLDELGLDYSETQIDAFMVCLAELRKWSRAYNLTALSSDRDVVIKHFLDSLLYLPSLPSGPVMLADIGSGGGFPGVPVKIMRPDIHVSLVEPSRKKAAFLKNIIRRLRLEGTVVEEQRVEDLAEHCRGKYDVILSRATFSLAQFLDRSCPCLKEGGVLIVSKGPKVAEELRELEGSPYGAGAVEAVIDMKLPLSGDKRKLVRLSCTMKK